MKRNSCGIPSLSRCGPLLPLTLQHVGIKASRSHHSEAFLYATVFTILSDGILQ